MELKGTKTEANLKEAFAGESQARNKYTFYASKARKDGYEQIANIFMETADNEKEHAKIWFKTLHDGKIDETYANLLDAAAGEKGEWSEMYLRMANDAKEEGFTRLAYQFEAIGKIEKEHEERFLALAKNIKEGKVFAKEEETVWICLNCGHIHIGKEAPKLCPVCEHPQSYFQKRNTNY